MNILPGKLILIFVNLSIFCQFKSTFLPRIAGDVYVKIEDTKGSDGKSDRCCRHVTVLSAPELSAPVLSAYIVVFHSFYSFIGYLGCFVANFLVLIFLGLFCISVI